MITMFKSTDSYITVEIIVYALTYENNKLGNIKRQLETQELNKPMTENYITLFQQNSSSIVNS